MERDALSNHDEFYKYHYHQVIWGIIAIILMLMATVALVFYQVQTRPMPQFYAVDPAQNRMALTAYDEPNLLPETILRWASKAATVAYTFNFSDYIRPNEKQYVARPYFTEEGWNDYLRSVSGLINTIVQNRLLVYSIVSGPPVISNQGPLPGKGYVWRVQIPFLVTYQSENTSVTNHFYVILSIVRVPTYINAAGIGIDQFVMV